MFAEAAIVLVLKGEPMHPVLIQPEHMPEGYAEFVVEPEPEEKYGITGPDAATWARLAECESGDWVDGGAAFVEGSARWDWGAPGFEHPPWSTRLFYGGLQFTLESWEWVTKRLGVYDEYPRPYMAPINVQVDAGRELESLQGFGRGWPTCSRLLGID